MAKSQPPINPDPPVRLRSRPFAPRSPPFAPRLQNRTRKDFPKKRKIERTGMMDDGNRNPPMKTKILMHGDGGEPKNRQTVSQEQSYILIRVVNNSPRQLISMLIVGAFTASSGSRTMRFAASLGRSNSLRHALSVLLTSAPGFASPRGLEDKQASKQTNQLAN